MVIMGYLPPGPPLPPTRRPTVCRHETLTAGPYCRCTQCGVPRPDPALPDPGMYENDGVPRWPYWMLLGVLIGGTVVMIMVYLSSVGVL